MNGWREAHADLRPHLTAARLLGLDPISVQDLELACDVQLRGRTFPAETGGTP
jgi:hypothetical protein